MRLGLGHGVGRSSGPADLRLGDHEPGARIDPDHGLGLLAGAEVGNHRVVVIALRAQHHDGVVGRALGPFAGLEAAVRGPLAGSDVAFDSLAQALVLHALDGRAGFVGQRRSGDPNNRGERGRGHPQAKSSHAAVPCFAPEGFVIGHRGACHDGALDRRRQLQ